MADMCEKIQKLGKGLSSPTRYHIIQILMHGPVSVNEIVNKTELSQPAISQHLRTLKSCGIVESSKRGQEVYYTLNTRCILDTLRGLTINVKKCKPVRIKK